MNILNLEYSIGLKNANDLQLKIQQTQFEKLVENVSQFGGYQTLYPLRNNFQRVNCIDINSYSNGRFYLTGMDNGSISLWEFDNSLKLLNDGSKDSRLINKRLNTSKGMTADTLNVSPKKNTDNTRLVHSFETQYNKFKLYRANSNVSALSHFDRKNEIDEQKTNYFGHQFGIKCLMWYGNDDGMFFSADHNKLIKIWDTNTFSSVQDIEFNYEINQIDSVPSVFNYILVASEDYYPRIIDLRNMNLGITIFGKNNKNSKTSCMKSSILTCKNNPIKDHIVASGDDDGRIKIWDLRMRNTLLLELQHNDNRFNNKAHVKSCNDLTWSENGNQLISIGLDGKILKWEPFNSALDATAKQIGDVDIPRNRLKKRTSQRLLMYHNFLMVNTDYGELQIFNTSDCKFWNKIEYPTDLLNDNHDSSGLFNGIAIQKDLTNSRGLRLLVGANSVHNTGSTLRNNIIEYAC